MNLLKRIIGHTRTIIFHKYWVAKYCFKLGLYKQGILHDLSKFSPVEYFEGVKYYIGTGSPINECKKEHGYSFAWFHHRGNNKHHYELWVDDFDHGGKMLIMPYKYAAEMICDYLAAARVYSHNAGKEFTYKDEFNWWIDTKMNESAMHSVIKNFVTDVLRSLKDLESEHKPIDSMFNQYVLYTTYKKYKDNFNGKDEYIRTREIMPNPRAFK